MSSIALGYKHYVPSENVSHILNPSRSVEYVRIVEGARASGHLVDLTQGRACRSAIVLKTGHVILTVKSTNAIKLQLDS